MTQQAYKEHHLASFWHGLFKQLSAHAPGIVVVHSYVDKAVAFGRIRVVRDQMRVGCNFGQQTGLVLGITGRNSDAIDLARQEILHHTLLPGYAIGGHQHGDIYPEFLRRIVRAPVSKDPK